MGPFEVDRGGWIGGQEIVTTEAGVTLATLRIEDPKDGPAPRWAIAVVGDQRLGSLAHDVATEADPRAPGELQAESGRSGHGTRQGAGEAGWLQHHEERLRAPGQSGETAQAFGQAGRTVRGWQAATGQVQDEQVHRASGEQRAPDGQSFIEGLRGDDHQPLEPDAAGDGFDRVEASREVDPGHDRPGRLGFRSHPKDEGGPAARAVAMERDACRARQASGSQDGIEGRKAGPNDPLVRVRSRLGPGRGLGPQAHGGRKGEGAFGDPRSCRSPASLEARHGCRHVRRECRHLSKIEHLFYQINLLEKTHPGGSRRLTGARVARHWLCGRPGEIARVAPFDEWGAACPVSGRGDPIR
jgi:hypothetical protein